MSPVDAHGARSGDHAAMLGRGPAPGNSGGSAPRPPALAVKAGAEMSGTPK